MIFLRSLLVICLTTVILMHLSAHEMSAESNPSGRVLTGPELVVGKCAAAPAIDGVLDDDIWRTAAKCMFLDSTTAETPLEQTDAWVAYDNTHLYLAFKCYESQIDELVAFQTERNIPETWKDDCIEIFLAPPIEPPPPAAVYFHILINSNTAFYAGSPYSGTDWEPNMRVETMRWDDSWTVEVAIAFQSLSASAPLPGEVWRTNLAREQKTHGSNMLSAWSPIGNNFHTPRLFGSFMFKHAPEADGKGSLIGVVKHKNEIVNNARVVLGKLITFTDAKGSFTLESVPVGPQTVNVTKDGFNPSIKRLHVENNQLVDTLFNLNEATPYGIDFPITTLSSDRPYQIYFNHVNSPIHPGDQPSEDQRAKEHDMTLQTVATLSSFEPVTFAVFADETLKSCKVSVSDLVCDDEPSATLESATAQITVVEVWIPPASMGGSGGYRPETLKPLTAVDMPAKTFRQYWITWNIPAGTSGGLYQGHITFEPRNRAKTVFSMEMTVFPFELEKSRSKRYGTFYLGGHGTSWLFNVDKQENDYRAEFLDMREHGIDGFTCPEVPVFTREGTETVVDYSPVERVLDLVKEIGWNDVMLVMNLGTVSREASDAHGLILEKALAYEFNEEHIGTITKTIKGINERVSARGLQAPYYMWLDEITQYGDKAVEKWVKMAKIFQAVSGDSKSFVTLEDNAPRKYWDLIAPYLDAAVCASTNHIARLQATYPSIGEWITYGGPGPRSGTIKVNRVDKGLQFYFSPVSQSWMWVYQAIVKGQETGPQYPWLTATVPAEDGTPMSTLQWEGHREGAKDLGYLITLENEIARCASRSGKREAVGEANSLLASITDQLRYLGAGEQDNGHVRSIYLMNLENDRFDDIRLRIGNMITKLKAQNEKAGEKDDN